MHQETPDLPCGCGPGSAADTASLHAPPPEPPARWLRMLVVTIAGAGLLALMFVMAGDVFGRYVFNRPIPGAYELVEYLMAIIVPFSIAYSAAQKCHVGVDILVEKLPRRTRAVVDVLTQAITIFLVAIVIWQGWVGFVEGQSSTIRSAVLQIPNYPFLLAAPLGFLAFVIFTLVNLAETIREALRP